MLFLISFCFTVTLFCSVTFVESVFLLNVNMLKPSCFCGCVFLLQLLTCCQCVVAFGAVIRGTLGPAGRGWGGGGRFGLLGRQWWWWWWWRGLSVCGRILAVTGHEDDRLGCHSPPLFLIGCDVPRWTSAQPGRLWLPAPPVRSHANTNCTISCFRGRAAALLASDACLGVIWLPLWCLQGLFGGSCTASLCVFFIRKTAEQITPKL